MMAEIYGTIADIYEHLQDDESRPIFRLRGLYSLTGDVEYFYEYVKKTPACRLLESASDEKPYIFGCGIFGKTLFGAVDKDWQGFVDNNKSQWGGHAWAKSIAAV